MNREVAKVFSSYPLKIQKKLHVLRQLILDTAEKTESVGQILETLKWGEPSYLTNRPKSGTTIRIAWKLSAPDTYGMYVSCNTSLIATFKKLYSDLFKYDGKRGILFHESDPLPKKELNHCIELALTYHLKK